MKIDYVSDLHINHHVLFNHNQTKWEQQTKLWTEKLMEKGTGDVLIVAGDFSEWNKQALWFLEVASLHYKHVLFGTGNHDRYLISKKQREKYGMSSNRIQEFLDEAAGIPHIVPMQRSVVTIDNVRFAGDGLWYRPLTPEDFSFYMSSSNDSVYIWEGLPIQETPEFLYREAMDWYRSLDGHPVDVMLSHVPPVHPPISPYPRNACYDCPVEFLVAPHWVCGHQHVQGDFQVAGTTFHMNALGYPSEQHLLELRSFTLLKEAK